MDNPQDDASIFSRKLQFAQIYQIIRETHKENPNKYQRKASNANDFQSRHSSLVLDAKEEELFLLALNSLDPHVLSGITLPNSADWQSFSQNSQSTKSHSQELHRFLHASNEAFKRTLKTIFGHLQYKEVIQSLIYIAIYANIQYIYSSFALAMVINFSLIKTKMYFIEKDIKQCEEKIGRNDNKEKNQENLGKLKTQYDLLEESCSAKSIFLYVIFNQLSPLFPNAFKLITIIYYEIRMFNDNANMLIRTYRNINANIKNLFLQLKQNFVKVERELALNAINEKLHQEHGISIGHYSRDMSEKPEKIATFSPQLSKNNDNIPNQLIDTSAETSLTLENQKQIQLKKLTPIEPNPSSSATPQTLPIKDSNEIIKKIEKLYDNLKKKPEYDGLHKILSRVLNPIPGRS
jgi:hypothetical protein